MPSIGHSLSAQAQVKLKAVQVGNHIASLGPPTDRRASHLPRQAEIQALIQIQIKSQPHSQCVRRLLPPPAGHRRRLSSRACHYYNQRPSPAQAGVPTSAEQALLPSARADI